MNASNVFRPCRMLAIMAVLFGAIVTTVPRAYAQQDVDPTWYDPWAPPAPAVVHTAQPQAASHKQQPKAKQVASSKRAAKVQARSAVAQTKPPAAL